MKTSKIISLIIFVLSNSFLIAQSAQSKLLPIANGEVLNYYDTGNSLLTLPIDNSLTAPMHDEEWLYEKICYDLNGNHENVIMNYVGQHPVFCQTIVHDDDGNLLFFIVDNNIYNKYGESFEVLNQPEYSESHYWLHQGKPDRVNDVIPLEVNLIAHENIVGEYLNRGYVFSSNGESPTGRFLLSPEIIVVPVPESCNEYFLIYSIGMVQNIQQAAHFTVFVRKLEYINDKEILMDTPKCLNNTSAGMCYNNSKLNLAITEYRPDRENHLLFIDDGAIEVLKVTSQGISTLAADRKNISYSNWDIGATISDRSEMEVIKTGQNYLLAVGVDPGNPYIDIIRFPYLFDDIEDFSCTSTCSEEFYFNEPSYYQGNAWFVNFSATNGGSPVGIEFSPNGDKLFATFRNQDGFYYADLCSLNIQGGEPIVQQLNISQPQMFHLSHIELDYQGNIIIQGDNESLPSMFYLLKINPTTLTYVNTSISSLLYKQWDFDIESHLNLPQYILMDQVDGSIYDGISTSNPVFCCNTIETWPDDSELTLNEVWSPGIDNNPFRCFENKIIIEEDVFISAGTIIEIKDMILEFFPGVKVYLEAGDSNTNGAYLKLNNSVFTSFDDCGTEDFWGGIVLEGNGEPQGKFIGSTGSPSLKVYNESKIESAIAGVQFKDGGIIEAGNSSFINNIQSVDFKPFQNTSVSGTLLLSNISKFDNCDFIIDDYYLDLTNATNTFQEHIKMENVEGIKFNECLFDNQLTSKKYYVGKNIGINSIHSGFFVDCNCDISLSTGDNCPDQYIHGCEFKNLTTAIQVLDGAKQVSIKNHYCPLKIS